MPGNSSLPPLKKNDGKLGILALLFLLGAGGLWFFSRGETPEPEVAPAEPAPIEVAPREQFAAELEIPEDIDLPAPDSEEPADDATPTASTPPSAGTVDPADWECSGTISPARVRSVLQGAPSKQVQTCYERGLKSNNLLQGSMEVVLTIDATGTVRAVGVWGTLRDRQVYSCVRRVARTWKFPAPQGGCVRISAPFQMTPKL
jgi:hypothetical protein